jgi:hypothetical protein
VSGLIAIPVFRVGCRVGIDRGRAWSVIDELILWTISRAPKTISELASESGLQEQVVVASLGRLMRFRLIELVLLSNAIAFQPSDYGSKAISSGNPLPFFPQRIFRRVSFVIEWATGDFFQTKQLRRLLSANALDRERRAGTQVRVVSVEGGGPSMSHEANLNRLSVIAARGWDEQVALIDGRTATMRDDQFMVLRILDGEVQGLPQTAGPKLRDVVAKIAALPGSTTHSVAYAGAVAEDDAIPKATCCDFDIKDLIIGGTAQRDTLHALLEQANRRFVVHSTFLDAKRFDALFDRIRAACARGVEFDILWGAEKDEETERRNANAAIAMANRVRSDAVTRGRVRIHMRTTGSHAKLLLLDKSDGAWIGVVGSCNWMSSPFESVELSVILRSQSLVAELATMVQRLGGRRGLADTLASEMALLARDLRRGAQEGGSAQVSLISGEQHDAIVRQGSAAARRQFVVGSNRLGSTARPGAILQGETAAQAGSKAIILYTQAAGPLKNRHARALQIEAANNGVTLRRTKKIPLHGKFVAWDEDDLVITSLNWASASSDGDFPWADVGVHIHAPGIGSEAIGRLTAIFPELSESTLEA